MAEFDHDLLKRLQYLALLAGGAAVAAGRARNCPAAARKYSLRDYAPGDDYRHIDWAWCARRDELLTRVFEGYDDAHLYILLDCSASMGAGRPSKFHLARQIAAALGYLALSRLDRLGVAAFADAWWPIAAAAAQVAVRPAAAIPGRSSARKRADRFCPLGCGLSPARRRGPVVVLSDLYDRHGFQPGLEILRYHGYEPRLVQIQDLHEAEPRLVGDVELLDVETQATRRVTITERMVRRLPPHFSLNSRLRLAGIATGTAFPACRSAAKCRRLKSSAQ